MGWHAHDVQSVNLAEFVFFRLRRSRHAAELFVKSEEVLERDRGNGLAFALNRHALLRFQSLVKSFGKAATEHHATRVLVDDDNLATTNHVVHVAIKQGVSLDAGAHMVEEPRL